MGKIKKQQKFQVGDMIRYKDGDGRAHKVVDARYIYYPNGEDWEYIIQDSVTGTTKIELGDSLLEKFEEKKKNKEEEE